MLDTLKTLFSPHSKEQRPPTAQDLDDTGPSTPSDDGNDGLRAEPRGTPLTWREIKQSYQRGPSFTRFLPWVEYLPESGCFLLEDGVSVGIAAEVTPLPTEGRSQAALSDLRDQIEATLQDAIPEYDSHPWVLQLYCRDEVDPLGDIAHLRQYADPKLLETTFTQAWLDSMEQHLQ